MTRQPRVLVAGGLEPSGRAGVFADFATVQALGGQPVGLATTLTAQGKKTFLTQQPSTRLIETQLRAIFELGRLDAVKTGVIAGPATIETFIEHFFDVDTPWVVDPVVGTSRGQLLSKLRPRDFLRLAAPNVVLTPNVVECAWLARQDLPTTVTEAAAMGARLQARGFRAVVVKGGHFRGEPVDLVCTGDAVELLHGQRLARTKESHRGTGCRFASALAVSLGRGLSVADAARDAKRFVEGYLRGL